MTTKGVDVMEKQNKKEPVKAPVKIDEKEAKKSLITFRQSLRKFQSRP